MHTHQWSASKCKYKHIHTHPSLSNQRTDTVRTVQKGGLANPSPHKITIFHMNLNKKILTKCLFTTSTFNIYQALQNIH